MIANFPWWCFHSTSILERSIHKYADTNTNTLFHPNLRRGFHPGDARQGSDFHALYTGWQSFNTLRVCCALSSISGGRHTSLSKPRSQPEFITHHLHCSLAIPTGSETNQDLGKLHSSTQKSSRNAWPPLTPNLSIICPCLSSIESAQVCIPQCRQGKHQKILFHSWAITSHYCIWARGQ